MSDHKCKCNLLFSPSHLETSHRGAPHDGTPQQVTKRKTVTLCQAEKWPVEGRPSPRPVLCAATTLHGWAIASLLLFPHSATTARNNKSDHLPTPASSVCSSVDLALRCAKLSHAALFFPPPALHWALHCTTALGITSLPLLRFCLFGLHFLPCPAPFLYRADPIGRF